MRELQILTKILFPQVEGSRLMAVHDSEMSPVPAHFLICALLLCFAIFAVVGCGGIGLSNDAMYTAASSQLTSAQEAGAAEYAKAEFEEAENLLAEAEVAMGNKDSRASLLIERACAKARLAEALARQSKAEAEAAKLEADLEESLEAVERASEERKSAESDLAQESMEHQ
jgi:hypothetical protein